MVVIMTLFLAEDLTLASPDLGIFEVSISKMVAIGLSDHTASQDTIVSRNHETAAVRGVETDESEGVEL